VGFFFVIVSGIERQGGGRLFFSREVWFLAILVEVCRSDQRTTAAVGSFHCLVALRGCELVGASSFSNRNSGRGPLSGAGSERVHVETCAGAGPAGAAASVAEEDGYGIIRMTGLNPDWRTELLAIELQLNDVFTLERHAICEGWS